MSAAAQSAWKPPDADRQPSAWSPPESDRTPPPEPGAVARFTQKYAAQTGINDLLDIMRASNRYGTPQEVAARGEKAQTALGHLVTGLRDEPARVWGEISNVGQSMLDPKQNTADMSMHMLGAVPMFGPVLQGFVHDVWAKKYPEAAADLATLGTLRYGPKAIEAAGEALPAVTRAVESVPTAVGGAVKGGWQGATGPTVLPIKVKGVQLAEIPNVPASISGAITGGGVGGLLGGGKGSVIGALSGATVPIVRGAVKGARSALADLEAAAVRAAQEEALANRVPLWEQQGTAATPRAVPQFTSQQPPMGMDIEGNLRPGPLPSGRRVPGEAAEVRGPTITPDDVLLLRYLGEKDPLSASAENIGIARDLAKQNPELVNRLRAGEPEPVVPPPTAAEAAAPTTQAVGTLEYNAPGITPAQERIVKGAQQAGEFTPEETARAAAILENVEPQAPPPAAAPAQTAETAGQLYAREWTARHPRLERLGMFELLDQRTKLAQEYFHKEFTNLTQVQKSAIDGELEQGMPLKPPPPTPAQPSAAAAPAAPQPQSAAPATAAPAAAETPLSWARAEIVDRGGQLPVSEIQRRFKMGYGAATDVLREAQGLRPKGEPIVTPPPTAQPPAPAAAAAPKPAAAELAQQFEATTRPDRMLDFLKRMDPEISPAAIDNLDPNQWELVARGAGSPAGTIPTPEDIAAVRGNLAQSEGASQITAKTPEAAKAQFEQNRNIRKGPAKATAPTGETWFHGTTKTFDNLDPEFSHPGSEHGKAVYLTNKHPEAAKYGDVRSIEFTGKIFPEEAAIDPPLLNEVVRQLKADHPARAQAITDALKRAELTRAKTHDIVLQEISSALPGDFRLRQTAINDALKKLGYSARSYTEDSGAKTLAVFDKDALTHKAPAPVTDLETQLADSLAGKRAAPPPEGPRALTAAEERVEAYVQHFAPDTENITSKTLEDLPKSTDALLQLEALGKRLGIKGRPASLDEVQQIVDRVRQLRGEAPRTLRTMMEGEKPSKKPPAAAKPAKQPAEMGAAEINRRLDQLDKKSSQLNDQFIEAGRGSERPSDYAKKTDPLSSEMNAVHDEMSDLRNEIARRYGPNAPSRLPARLGPIKSKR